MYEPTARERAEELSDAYRAAERSRAYHGGFLIFLLSESMFFLSLLASRFVLAGGGHPASLDQMVAAIVTAVVVVSLYPVTAMQRAADNGRWSSVQRFAVLTALAGLVLLAGVAWEWHGLALDPQSRYGGIYYFTVGMHALHVFIAVLLMLGIAGRARAGRFTERSRFGVQAGQLFWYLIAGLWLAVWAVFYLG